MPLIGHKRNKYIKFQKYIDKLWRSKDCTFYTGSVSCTVNEDHVSDNLPHIALKPKQGASQLS